MTDFSDFRTAPLDPTSRSALADVHLSYELLDAASTDPDARARFEAWWRVVQRGFLGSELSAELVAPQLDGLASRRTIGVYDPAQSAQSAQSTQPAHAAQPAQSAPVGTVDSWPAQLTVPGNATIPAWAISLVSVAPTHRRRGIARALLEGELRTAAALGLPMAMLTVSESTIYGRFGFAPAALAADYTIDTRRARWTGPATTEGRIEFTTLAQFREDIAALHDRTRLRHPGQIEAWPLRWDQLAGIHPTDPSSVEKLRAVRFVDAAGETRGAAIYQVRGGDDDFTKHTVQVERLTTETPDAYAALWRFFLEMDLVTEVVAELRSVDEPLRWQIADFRAIKMTTDDHLWLRILDVKACLEARTYPHASDGDLILDVTDDLGFAQGTWRLSLVEQRCEATRLEIREPTETSTHALKLSANALAAIYLGGVSVTTLVAAGLVEESTPGSAAAAGRIFAASVTPWLSLWF